MVHAVVIADVALAVFEEEFLVTLETGGTIAPLAVLIAEKALTIFQPEAFSTILALRGVLTLEAATIVITLIAFPIAEKESLSAKLALHTVFFAGEAVSIVAGSADTCLKRMHLRTFSI